MTAPLRVIGVADTDSYVKWTAALLGAAPAEWNVSLLVLDTPVSVSPAQLRAAVTGGRIAVDDVERMSFAAFERRMASDPPDVVLLGARGPLVRVLARSVAGVSPRPVIVSGLPGISIPATRAALLHRTQADLFIVHSHREVRDFARLAALHGLDPVIGLATLPFAARVRAVGRGASTGEGGSTGGDLVFAAQAKVPASREDRMRVASILRRAALADPGRRVVLKLRGVKGEHQTHAEADPYPDLMPELGAVPGNLVTSTAPMGEALSGSEGLVTVSSTAAIEALAAGIPVIALDAFGVSDELINPVFEGSGLFGSADDVVARRFRHPHPSWLADNYLHDSGDDDWARRVGDLVHRRRAGRLAPRAARRRRGGRVRDAWERKLVLGPMDRTPSGAVAFAIGMPLRAVVRLARRAGSRQQRSLG